MASHVSLSCYQSRLFLLFFTALANLRGQDPNRLPALFEDSIGTVPFLNGGLFEKADLDKRPGVYVPDEAIRLILEDLFARYNFTIAESTPYDVEVAVDPEMLGKVFEELVTGRHETGSYYTPRPIVTFMCREALKGYLATRVPGLGAETIAAFVDNRETRDISVMQAPMVLAALERITVVDPACGSGAYLLGMLHELVELRSLLYSEKLKHDAKSQYDLKLQVIERNLYGVDIDEFAVNIAKLRLWLSLVIEYEGDAPPPLPNLDFKIVRGDSLLAPDLGSTLQTDMFLQAAHQDAAELSRLKEQFLRETGEEKHLLERQIVGVRAKLTAALRDVPSPKDSVDWRVEFAEVFDQNGGFDVALANPPYVRQELIKEIKPGLQRVYGDLYSGTADLYVYFYYRALQLLNQGGMLVFISSNKWFRAAYGAKLRAHVAATATVRSITDFGDLPVFEAATAYPMIFLAQKGAVTQAARLTQVRSLAPPYPDVLALTNEIGQTLPAQSLVGSEWSLVDSDSAARLQKMKASSVPLGDYVKGQIYRGVLTGFNQAFVISGSKRAELISADPKSAEIIKPLVVGRDIRKWCIDYKDKHLIFTRHGTDIEKYPAIYSHLLKWKSKLTPKVTGQEDEGRKPGRYKWHEIQDDVAYYAAFARPKIMYPVIAKAPTFTFDRIGALTNDKTFIIPRSDMYLLGVLNSSTAWSLLESICSMLSGGFWELRSVHLGTLPIPNASPSDRAAIADLVQKCLDAKGQGLEVAEWEAEINARVARLYGV
jgi:hypothetical protein